MDTILRREDRGEPRLGAPDLCRRGPVSWLRRVAEMVQDGRSDIDRTPGVGVDDRLIEVGTGKTLAEFVMSGRVPVVPGGLARGVPAAELGLGDPPAGDKPDRTDRESERVAVAIPIRAGGGQQTADVLQRCGLADALGPVEEDRVPAIAGHHCTLSMRVGRPAPPISGVHRRSAGPAGLRRSRGGDHARPSGCGSRRPACCRTR